MIALVREKALKFGEFTLASGKKATYYLDGKQVTLDPTGARLVAEGMLDLLAAGQMPAAVGGMSIGADPITAAVVTMSAVRGTPLVGFMVRKESKGHGTNQFIEGPVKPGLSAVIVEDVVTTGGSSLKAIERVEAFGMKVVGVLAIIDRMEGGAQAFAQRGYPLCQPADDPRFRHRAASGVEACVTHSRANLVSADSSAARIALTAEQVRRLSFLTFRQNLSCRSHFPRLTFPVWMHWYSGS